MSQESRRRSGPGGRATTCAAALALFDRGRCSAVIVEALLADGSGLDVVDDVRRVGSTALVIVVTDSAAPADREETLRRGADDHMVQPFPVDALTARVLAARRRSSPPADARLKAGPLAIDRSTREVVVGGRRLDLTAKEFDLLAYPAARPGHVFGREELLRALWSPTGAEAPTATVTEHIHRLRAKVEVDPDTPQLIRTVRGIGYRLRALAADGEGGGAQHPTAGALGTFLHVDGRVMVADRASAVIFGADPARSGRPARRRHPRHQGSPRTTAPSTQPLYPQGCLDIP